MCSQTIKCCYVYVASDLINMAAFGTCVCCILQPLVFAATYFGKLDIYFLFIHEQNCYCKLDYIF